MRQTGQAVRKVTALKSIDAFKDADTIVSDAKTYARKIAAIFDTKWCADDSGKRMSFVNFVHECQRTHVAGRWEMLEVDIAMRILGRKHIVSADGTCVAAWRALFEAAPMTVVQCLNSMIISEPKMRDIIIAARAYGKGKVADRKTSSCYSALAPCGWAFGHLDITKTG